MTHLLANAAEYLRISIVILALGSVSIVFILATIEAFKK